MHTFRVLAPVLLVALFATQRDPQSDQKDTELMSISGKILRADTRAPLPNVQVVVSGPSPDNETAQEDDPNEVEERQFGTTSNEKGEFKLQNLKPGKYRLRASRAGMTMKAGADMGMIVQVQPANSQEVTVLMLQAGAITGGVLNEQGEPMQSVSVSAMRYAYSVRGRHLTSVQNSTTDDRGGYRLFGLKPGSYLVLVGPGAGEMQSVGDNGSRATAPVGGRKVIRTTYGPTFYPNQSSPEQATPIAVRGGDEAQANFSLTRVPAYRISGKIIGLAPLAANASADQLRYVTAMRQGVELHSLMGNVKKDFSFEIEAATPGNYKLIAIDNDAGSQSVNYGAKDVTVASSDVTGIIIPLNSSRGHLRGVLRPDGDKLLDMNRLYVAFVPTQLESGSSGDLSPGLELSSGAGGYAKVERDGSFKADLMLAPSSVYVVVAAQSDYEDWYTSSVLLNGRDVSDSGFKLADAVQGKLEIVISSKGGTVEGTALDFEKKPFPNAQIIALPSDLKRRKRFDLLQKATADQQGRFKLRGVRPGEYIVMALEDTQEQPFLEDSFIKQNVNKMRTLKIGQSKYQIQLETIEAEE